MVESDKMDSGISRGRLYNLFKYDIPLSSTCTIPLGSDTGNHLRVTEVGREAPDLSIDFSYLTFD